MRNKRGFTLLEITVVVAIISLLATIFLANYRGGERQFALKRSAHKLAQDLRTVQEMALSGQRTPPALFGEEIFPRGGYGIYFSPDSNSYILFADCNDNKEYDPSGPATSCLEASPAIPYPEKIKDLFLEEGVKISELSTGPSLSITFFPPDPTITISPPANFATITLSFDNLSRQVYINTAGLIDPD